MRHLKERSILWVVFVILTLVIAGHAGADDVEDSINEALEYYKRR